MKDSGKEDEEEIRYYDLSITYDFYYLTPRLWVSGNQYGKPLTNEQIFEDIMIEYVNKTVTIEQHPHLGIKQASVHPCKHAKVMKNFVDTMIENDKKFGNLFNIKFLYLFNNKNKEFIRHCFYFLNLCLL